MKDILSQLRLIIIYVPILVMCQYHVAHGFPLCSDEGASLAARAYSMAFPLYDEDSYQEFVIDNSSAFQHDGEAITCLRQLGIVFYKMGLVQQDETPDDRTAQRLFWEGMPEEVSHLPSEVDNAISESNIKIKGPLALIGKSFLWLSQVLPEAANGSWESFNNSNDFLYRDALARYNLLREYCELRLMPSALCDDSIFADTSYENIYVLEDLALASTYPEFESILINAMYESFGNMAQQMMGKE
ncbi:MAG: hypothetical protein ABFR97_11140 [Thermodesulfobacteriota bacterium]